MSSLKDIFSISRKRYTLHCKPTEIETHMRKKKKKKSFSKNHEARNFQRAGRFIRDISFTHPNTRACFQMISEHLDDLWTIGHILGTNLAAGLLASLSFTPLPCSFSWPSITLQPLSLRYAFSQAESLQAVPWWPGLAACSICSSCTGADILKEHKGNQSSRRSSH